MAMGLASASWRNPPIRGDWAAPARPVQSHACLLRKKRAPDQGGPSSVSVLLSRRARTFSVNPGPALPAVHTGASVILLAKEAVGARRCYASSEVPVFHPRLKRSSAPWSKLGVARAYFRAWRTSTAPIRKPIPTIIKDPRGHTRSQGLAQAELNGR